MEVSLCCVDAEFVVVINPSLCVVVSLVVASLVVVAFVIVSLVVVARSVIALVVASFPPVVIRCSVVVVETAGVVV